MNMTNPAQIIIDALMQRKDTTMTDTDEMNAYSYKGSNFLSDLTDYLNTQNVAVDAAEWSNGSISLFLEGRKDPVKVPQYAQWHDIAERVKK